MCQNTLAVSNNASLIGRATLAGTGVWRTCLQVCEESFAIALAELLVRMLPSSYALDGPEIIKNGGK